MKNMFTPRLFAMVTLLVVMSLACEDESSSSTTGNESAGEAAGAGLGPHY